MNLIFVSGNYGKFVSVRDSFMEEGIDINYLDYDLEEPDVNDISYISKAKAFNAYSILKSPVFVIDSGFYIVNYPENPMYPGAFVKRSGVSSDVNGLLEIMRDVKNRECYFLDCLTVYDGENYYQFYGKSEGTISEVVRGCELKKAKSNLWKVFIPKNCDKTLAEMSDYERENRPDGRTSATHEFINWYKNNYINTKKLMKL